jgi:hypothetical protein
MGIVIFTVGFLSALILFLFLRVEIESVKVLPTSSLQNDEIKSIAVLPFNPVSDADRNDTKNLELAFLMIKHLKQAKNLRVSEFSAIKSYTEVKQDAIAAARVELKIISKPSSRTQKQASLKGLFSSRILTGAPKLPPKGISLT